MGKNYLHKRSQILGLYENRKIRIIAIIKKLGYKNLQRTLLLSDLYINDSKVDIDHLWVRIGDKTFEGYMHLLIPESKVKFQAWVEPYVHGYCNDREYVDERSVEMGLLRMSSLEVSLNGGDFIKAKITKTPMKDKVNNLIEKWMGYIRDSNNKGNLYGRGIAIVVRNALKINYDLTELNGIIKTYSSNIDLIKNKAQEIYPDGKSTARQSREWSIFIRAYKKCRTKNIPDIFIEAFADTKVE
jgi:hypothetical protein